MLLGYSRGSVGDVTFYRAGGSQRQRARNRNPNNPRTPAQMAQRSIFANAVKFFKQVNTGFFRYAFEDKKPNESDYNAFMRHNVVNSGYIGARASKISDWPALGLWELSAGSLPEITAPFPQPQDTGAGLYFSVGVSFPNDPNTIGELSAALINGAPNTWRVGDILTCVMYRATYANTLPTTDTEEEHRAYADYMQIIVDPNDTTPLRNITLDLADISFMFSPDADGLYIVGTTPSIMEIWPRDLFGFSVIHSRNTASGLQVSPSTMVYNKRELPLLAMSDTGAYYSAVLADWQASADAILQGAAASRSSSVLGWSANETGPFTQAVLSFTAADEQPSGELVYIKFENAAAAQAALDTITAEMNGAGETSAAPQANNDVVIVEWTYRLAQTTSSASLKLGNTTIATIRR